MCQRLNTGESNNFYFGIFICIGPLISILIRQYSVDLYSSWMTAGGVATVHVTLF